MFNLPTDSATIILGVATIITTFLYLHEYNLRKRGERKGEKVLEEFREKGWETLHQSIAKSQQILGTAELEGVKVAADTRFATNAKLSQAIEQSEQAIKDIKHQFSQYIEGLERKSANFEETLSSSTQQRINQMLEHLEERLTDFLTKTETATTSSIELELKSSRQLIDTYKSQQLQLIDENILAMMEQTLNIVLGKKLSLKDQLDLVYEALEKAKVDKFIV